MPAIPVLFPPHSSSYVQGTFVRRFPLDKGPKSRAASPTGGGPSAIRAFTGVTGAVGEGGRRE
ncbi:hypothetical protein GCM10022419_047270 [Nonomuraea rosea]|uniref:Uncharacterized protein n=1 Tax=Nonomuraea rosea TaxID=638574 RepID=A0ABP6X574_9ACTN